MFFSLFCQIFIQADETLATRELENYLEGRGIWKVDLTRALNGHASTPSNNNVTNQSNIGTANLGASPSGQSDEKTFIPQGPINNYSLGNIVNYMLHAKFPPEKFKMTPSFPKDGSVIISLLGYPYSGKKTVANFLASKYHLHIVKLEEIISELFSKVR